MLSENRGKIGLRPATLLKLALNHFAGCLYRFSHLK